MMLKNAKIRTMITSNNYWFSPERFTTSFYNGVLFVNAFLFLIDLNLSSHGSSLSSYFHNALPKDNDTMCIHGVLASLNVDLSGSFGSSEHGCL